MDPRDCQQGDRREQQKSNACARFYRCATRRCDGDIFGGAGLAAAPTVKLNPTSDHPTATDQVSGSGFGASEAVDIYFDTTDMLLATTTTTGTIPWHSWQVPANATPGQHWITAIGRKTGDAAQKPFTVATDWSQRGFNAHGKRINPYENVLTTANVSALDIAWSTTTGGGIASSPAVADGVVYAGSLDGKLYAFDAATGAVLWTATTGSSIYSSPAVAKGVVYVGGKDTKLYAYNATTGAVLWSATTGPAFILRRRWRTAWSMSDRLTINSMPSMLRPAPCCGLQRQETSSTLLRRR